MAYEKKNGDIAVFREKTKKSERAPDWKGDALIDGIVYSVAFWEKSETMLAGKIEIKKEYASSEKPGAYERTGKPNSDDIMDDFPF